MHTGQTGLSGLSGMAGLGGTPYAPSLKFNDARNSMYAGLVF